MSDWLELGDRLGPDQRQALLALFEREESRLEASRENLRRIERMMGEGSILLDKIRGLRAAAALEPPDEARLDAVIHIIEETQRVMATHYARLCREWLRWPTPPDQPAGAAKPGQED